VRVFYLGDLSPSFLMQKDFTKKKKAKENQIDELAERLADILIEQINETNDRSKKG
jgi:hypothetical protein